MNDGSLVDMGKTRKVHYEEEKHPRQESLVRGIRGERSRPRPEWFWNDSQAMKGPGMCC